MKDYRKRVGKRMDEKENKTKKKRKEKERERERKMNEQWIDEQN